jgi:hypothetical protein
MISLKYQNHDGAWDMVNSLELCVVYCIAFVLMAAYKLAMEGAYLLDFALIATSICCVENLGARALLLKQVKISEVLALSASLNQLFIIYILWPYVFFAKDRLEVGQCMSRV